MSNFERFALQPMQKYTHTLDGCPVRICCSRQCTEARSGVNFVQVRMQNLTEQFIFNVVLNIEAFDNQGEKLYELRRVILANCNAEPGAFFGEDRMIALTGPLASSLEITVENVVFDEGMLWRKNTIYRRAKSAQEEAPAEEAPAEEAPAAEEVPLTAEETPLPENDAPTAGQEAPMVEEPIAPKPVEKEPIVSMVGNIERDIAAKLAEIEAFGGKPIEKIFEHEEGEPISPMFATSQSTNEIFKEIFNPARDFPEQKSPAREVPEPPEQDPIQPPTAAEEQVIAEPVKKKKSYALLIWLLVLLGVGLAAYALYLLYVNGIFSAFL